MKKITFNRLVFTTAALALVVGAQTSRADDTPGSLFTFSNGTGDTQNLFTLSGDTVTVLGDLTEANKYYLTGTVAGTTGKFQLLGIARVYFVDVSTGTPQPGPALPGTLDGYVATTPTSGTHVAWIDNTQNSYPAYGDSANKPYDTGNSWIRVGNPGDVGKSGGTDYPYGSFTFASALGTTSNPTYDIGIDYLVNDGGTGQTGRAYFKYVPAVAGVPEGSYLQTALLGTGVLGLLQVRRRRTA